MRRVHRLVLRCARRASRSGLVGLIAERRGVPRGRLKEDTLQKQSEIPRVPPVSVEGVPSSPGRKLMHLFPG